MASQNPGSEQNNHVEDDDTDAIFAELEAEADDTTSIAYQQRMAELRAQSANSVSGVNMPAPRSVQQMYVNLRSDDETLRFTTEHEKAIVHFRHAGFARCAIMDEHLEKIAQAHNVGETSGEEIVFAKADVNTAPFVVEKLGVRVLPCVIGFAKGIVKGKIVGFEGVCWDSKEKDSRVTKSIEETFFSWGLLKQKSLTDDYDSDSDHASANHKKGGLANGVRRGIRDAKQKVLDEDDDWD